MSIEYGSPVVDGAESGIGPQIRTDTFNKKALVDAAKESYFGQMSSTESMPKNMGKKIKRFHYLPMLDDRNLNDQGIDATTAATGDAGQPIGLSGANTAKKVAYISILLTGQATPQTFYVRGDSTTSAAAALIEAQTNFVAWALGEGFSGITDIDQTGFPADIQTAYGELTDGSADAVSQDVAGGVTGVYTVTEIAATDTSNYGNLYGSSKDIGTIQGKIPALSENGGRVNRVGMRRVQLEGTLEKFGFFDEYTQESLDFDSDPELLMRITGEAVKGANELTEDQIQIDLINGAGVIRYAGGATSIATLQGDDVADPFAVGNTNDIVTYDDLVKLGIELDQNRTPTNTTIIAGSRMVDTKVINAARYIYIGAELQTVIMRMTDYHGVKAFIPVAQYANGGNIARGEIGAVDSFRFILVPEMMHKAAGGAAIATTVEETTPFRYSSTADGALFAYNAYPMLVVGDGAFVTVGFQTDGKTVKYVIHHKAPDQNVRPEEPFGETGFYSIKWYYGMMILRAERIAVLWTLAEW